MRPSARSNAAILMFRGKLQVFGGMTFDKERLNDLWECSILSGECQLVNIFGNKHPHKRRSMNFHLRDDSPIPELLLFGGWCKFDLKVE